MKKTTRVISLAAIIGASALGGALLAYQKEAIEGIRNFTKIDASFACAGSTDPSAMATLAKRGFKGVLSLREPSETGALISENEAAARDAGIRFINVPFSNTSPTDAAMDRALAVVRDGANQPLLIYCASGSRAGAVWMAKRMLIDQWDAQRAFDEARDIGLSSPSLKAFVLDYVSRHKL